MFILVSSVIPVFLSAIATYFLYKKYEEIQLSHNFIKIFIFFWFLIFLVQFFILGPFSPIHYYDNADIGLSRILYEKYHHLGGRYLHGVLGGQDMYSTQAFGGQLISLEKIIFFNFPIWLSVLIHKFLLLFIGFYGSYLLFHSAYKFEKIDSVFVASLITIFNPYTVTSTIQHGLGYSVVPLAIFLILYQTDKKFYFLKVFLLSILISISTTPFHSFLAVMGGLVISFFLKKPKNIKKYLISILILLFFIILNWHESFYSMYELRENSNRSFSNFNLNPFLIFGSIEWMSKKTELCFINCNLQYSPIVILFIFLLFALLITKNFKYAFILLVANYAPNIGSIIINFLKLDSIKTLNLYNYSYYLVIPISFFLLTIHKEKKDIFHFKKIPIVFLFFSLIYLFNYKFVYAKKIFYESQQSIYSIKNLVKREWEPKKFYRMISTNPWDMFHPNFLWAYGIDTSDGYVNLVDINFSKFWHHGVKKIKLTEDVGKYYYGGNFFINDVLKFDEFNLNQEIDLNLLKLTNTGFVASYVPLLSEDLSLVSGDPKLPISSSNVEAKKRDINFYFNQVKEQSQYIFKPKDILIYKIKDYSDRFFFPKKIKRYSSSANIYEKYRNLSKNYERNIALVSRDGLDIAEGKILKSKKIKNGYSLDVNVNEDGLLVFNSFFQKYWKAYSNDIEIPILNLNGLQMGVLVKEQTKKLDFIYSRKTLKEIIRNK